ncbi:MAG: hypothetical protein ACE5DX_04575 [Candidatus Dojkabacteria bacterium]
MAGDVYKVTQEEHTRGSVERLELGDRLTKMDTFFRHRLDYISHLDAKDVIPSGGMFDDANKVKHELRALVELGYAGQVAAIVDGLVEEDNTRSVLIVKKMGYVLGTLARAGEVEVVLHTLRAYVQEEEKSEAGDDFDFNLDDELPINAVQEVLIGLANMQEDQEVVLDLLGSLVIDRAVSVRGSCDRLEVIGNILGVVIANERTEQLYERVMGIIESELEQLDTTGVGAFFGVLGKLASEGYRNRIRRIVFERATRKGIDMLADPERVHLFGLDLVTEPDDLQALVDLRSRYEKGELLDDRRVRSLDEDKNGYQHWLVINVDIYNRRPKLRRTLDKIIKDDIQGARGYFRESEARYYPNDEWLAEIESDAKERLLSHIAPMLDKAQALGTWENIGPMFFEALGVESVVELESVLNKHWKDLAAATEAWAQHVAQGVQAPELESEQESSTLHMDMLLGLRAQLARSLEEVPFQEGDGVTKKYVNETWSRMYLQLEGLSLVELQFLRLFIDRYGVFHPKIISLISGQRARHKLEIAKTGSKLEMFVGGKGHGVIIRTQPIEANDTWERASKISPKFSLEHPEDALPTEVILKRDGERMYTAFGGMTASSLLRYLEDIQAPQESRDHFRSVVEKRVAAMRQIMHEHGIDHGHDHFENFVISFVRTPYLLDVDGSPKDLNTGDFKFDPDNISFDPLVWLTDPNEWQIIVRVIDFDRAKNSMG